MTFRAGPRSRWRDGGAAEAEVQAWRKRLLGDGAAGSLGVETAHAQAELPAGAEQVEKRDSSLAVLTTLADGTTFVRKRGGWRGRSDLIGGRPGARPRASSRAAATRRTGRVASTTRSTSAGRSRRIRSSESRVGTRISSAAVRMPCRHALDDLGDDEDPADTAW